MSEGWIKLHRKIQENEMWFDDEPFDKRSAFIDLLLMANFSDKNVVFDGKVIELKAGQKITSVRHLAERWRWSTNKVSRYLKLLEELKIITRKTDNKKTLLTIVNYGVYQGAYHTDEYTDEYTDEHAENTQTNTQTNDKQERKERKKDNTSLSETANKIVELYHVNCPSFPRVIKITDKRVKSINARLKDYSEMEIGLVFRKAESSDFLRNGSEKWSGADFDWIMNPNNFVKILEGKYDNKETPKRQDGMIRTTYDFEALNRYVKEN